MGVANPEPILEGRYSIWINLRSGSRSESYRIKDPEGRNYFFKMVDSRKTKPMEY
jgi:hypothetical protein